MHTISSKSDKKIQIRSPELSDTQIMLDFINALGKEDIYINVNPDDLFNLKQEEAFVKLTVKKIQLKLAVYYLAFFQDQLIGSASVTKNDKRMKHIGNFGITIAKAYRNDGIGYQLANFIIKKAQEELGITKITLSVFDINEPAINLYQHLGFTNYGHLPNGFSYKGGYQDEFLMYKDLL